MTWGILYPRSHRPPSEGRGPRFDFVISPTPFRLWPLTGRLIVNVNHRRGAFKRIADVLARQSANILVSEGARSGHRYATWNLIIACDDMESEGLTGYTPELKGYPAVNKRLKRIKTALERECRDVLYVENSKDPSLKDSVRVVPHHSMAYFHHLCHQRRETPEFSGIPNEIFYKPFQLSCSDGVTLKPENTGFGEIVQYIDANIKRIIPSHAFISSSSFDMNMRVVIVPQEREKRFFGATVRFDRLGHPPSSRGFIDQVLGSMQKDFNIWGLSNVTYLDSREQEAGITSVIAYDKTDKGGSRTLQERESIIRDRLNMATVSKSLPSIRNVVVDCYPLDALQTSASRQPLGPTLPARLSKKFDIFFSYCRENKTEALKLAGILKRRQLRVFLDEKSVPYGGDFGEEIVKSLRNSKEFMILCTKASLESDWVKREVGAAWGLDLTIIPITLNLESKDLPAWLNTKQACPYAEAVEKKSKWSFFSQFAGRDQEAT